MEQGRNLGDAIRKVRQEKGLSQGEMQKRTGILRSYLSRVENGHTIPSFATLQRLAAAMGVAMADFFPSDDGAAPGTSGAKPGAAGVSKVSDYLQELKTYIPHLSPDQRKQVLKMVKDLAGSSHKH